MRSVLALALGAAVAVVLALIVGEYPFAGFTPYLVAAAVPAIIGTVVVWTGRRHPDRLWAASGLLGGASIGWALWISTGHGLDPVPAERLGLHRPGRGLAPHLGCDHGPP